MTLKTIGTLATTTLQGFQAPPGYNATPGEVVADIATFNASIYDDLRNPQQLLNQAIVNQAFARHGMLFVPNRGFLRVFAGDWIAFDPNGWPILIGKESLAQTLTATGTTTNTSPTVTALSVNVLNLGWWAGMAITGTNVPVSTVIKAIASNGLSLTLSNNATGGASGTTFTVGSWTHN
jgi:hypothetical protein